jgi:FkbM family methyltransferase
MWRLGRKLYRAARGESDNRMATNGEEFVQRCVAAGTAKDVAGPVTVLDVGANVGIWTQGLFRHLSVEQRESIRSYAFEPIPETFERLQQNLADLGGAVPCTMQVAFSDSQGEAEMVVMQKFGGTNSLEFDASMASAAEEIVRVRKTTLATFCDEEKIDRVELMKIDTEGHDSFVLKGAVDLFQEGRIDVAQFEYNHRWVYSRSYLKDVFDLLEGLPYRVARIRGDRLELFEDWHPEIERYFEANYLIVRDAAIDWFPTLRGRFDESNTYA